MKKAISNIYSGLVKEPIAKGVGDLKWAVQDYKNTWEICNEGGKVDRTLAKATLLGITPVLVLDNLFCAAATTVTASAGNALDLIKGTYEKED